MTQDIEVGMEQHAKPAKVDPAKLSHLNTLEQGLLATYDFTKHTSMLSLVAMGGMLALLQGSGQPVTKSGMVSIAIVGLAGFLSLYFMTTAAATQIAQRAHKTNKWLALFMVNSILLLFAAGVTVFFLTITKAGMPK